MVKPNTSVPKKVTIVCSYVSLSYFHFAVHYTRHQCAICVQGSRLLICSHCYAVVATHLVKCKTFNRVALANWSLVYALQKCNQLINHVTQRYCCAGKQSGFLYKCSLLHLVPYTLYFIRLLPYRVAVVTQVTITARCFTRFVKMFGLSKYVRCRRNRMCIIIHIYICMQEHLAKPL